MIDINVCGGDVNICIFRFYFVSVRFFFSFSRISKRDWSIQKLNFCSLDDVNDDKEKTTGEFSKLNSFFSLSPITIIVHRHHHHQLDTVQRRRSNRHFSLSSSFLHFIHQFNGQFFFLLIQSEEENRVYFFFIIKIYISHIFIMIIMMCDVW